MTRTTKITLLFEHFVVREDPEVGSGVFLWNVRLSSDYTALHPIRQSSEMWYNCKTEGFVFLCARDSDVSWQIPHDVRVTRFFIDDVILFELSTSLIRGKGFTRVNWDYLYPYMKWTQIYMYIKPAVRNEGTLGLHKAKRCPSARRPVGPARVKLWTVKLASVRPGGKLNTGIHERISCDTASINTK